MTTVFEAVGGSDGVRRLADAWHRRVLADEIVSYAFSHGYRPDHTERLAAYWAEVLGGPPEYSTAYGDHTGVVRMHTGNGVHTEMDERAVACFDAALTDTGLDDDARLRTTLHDWFAWSTTVSMNAHQGTPDTVPAGLPMPRWSWDGPVSGG